jgi:hypothetical protein
MLTLLATLAALALTTRPLLAYIDPAAGGMLYQSITAVLVGLGIVLWTSRERIARFVRGARGSRVTHQSIPPQEKR